MKMSQILNDSSAQIKLSLESGKNGSAPETSGKRQCENLRLRPSLLSSSRTLIWFKCSPPVLPLACKISLSSESAAFCQHFMSKFTRFPATVMNEQQDVFGSRFPTERGSVSRGAHHWHSILDWEVFIAPAPLRFAWICQIWLWAEAARSRDFWKWAGPTDLHCTKLCSVLTVGSVEGEFWKLSRRETVVGGSWGVFVSLKWQLRGTPWHLRIRRLSFEEAKFRANLSLRSLAPRHIEQVTRPLHVCIPDI